MSYFPAQALLSGVIFVCLGALGCESRMAGSQGGSPSQAAGGSLGGDGSTLPAAPGGVVPGRGTLQRLNRAEYNNTVRDLLGTTERPGDNLPAEDLSFGFDNIGDALNVSRLHVEIYLSAAERLVEEALAPTAPLRARILTCDVDTGGSDCAKTIIRAFARRAFRRPATEPQVERLAQFLAVAQAQGDPPLVGLKLALKATLVSAKFLFRPELDPAPVPTEPWLVDDFELASRLSYFLWSSMPDEALLQSAEAGLLQREQTLSEQVQRMIVDPRSAELIVNFAGQWLHLRAVARHQPDRQLFPEFTGELAQSMTRSTELFFRNLLDARLPIEELVTSAAVPVNGALAAHYGIAAAADQGFLSLATPAGRGAGVLGHASVLLVTSEPGRTSPVKRGAWVLSNLLCSPPPPPPPGVEGLDEAPTGGESLTVRQRLELHRTDPACAACHRVMDPIGFGLENFDAVGRWRTEDQGQPLDTRGTLPDGTTFSSAEELGRIVANDPRFRRCVAQKLATYALGRGIEADRDSALIEAVVSETASGDGSLVAIATALIRSPAFRMRSPEQNGAP